MHGRTTASFRLVLGDDYLARASDDERETLVALAIDTEDVVDRSVAEHSLNLQSIEASITSALLPVLFKSMGMDKAKEAIEKIIHITRIGLVKQDIG